MGQMTLPVILEGFGHFCGCDYCISELKAAIDMEEAGETLIPNHQLSGFPCYEKGEPRPVPDSWRQALKLAEAQAEAE